MKFYDIDNNIVNIDNYILNNKINNGCCATVYRYDENTCLKIYDKDNVNSTFHIDCFLLDNLKNIKSDNLAEIQKLLYKTKGKYKYEADAYLVKYYEKKYDNLLETPSDYLLDNFDRILKLSSELANNNIRFDDLKKDNIILSSNDIILIDPDSWKFIYSGRKKMITDLNINNIIAMFNSIVNIELNRYYLDFLRKNKLFYYVICDKLFPLTSNPNKAIKVLSKSLKGHQRPIDYIYSMKK